MTPTNFRRVAESVAESVANGLSEISKRSPLMGLNPEGRSWDEIADRILRSVPKNTESKIFRDMPNLDPCMNVNYI